jgi:O-antigen ligase
MSFFFALVFIVLVFWRPQEWLVPALYGWPMLDAVVYMSVLGVLLESKAGIIEFPRKLPQVWLLMALFVVCVFSHVPHTYFQGILDTIPVAFKITFFSLLLICVLDSDRRFRVVAGVFVAMACFMAVHALLQQSRGYGFGGQQPLWIPAIGNRPAHTRSQFFGIFSDPNDLAQMLTTALPFAFVVFRSRWLSLAFGSAVSWLLVEGVLSTHSRGGLVALAGIGGVVVALMFPKRWFPYLMAGMLLGAMALCPLSVGLLDQSAHDRVVFWGMANEKFKHNLLFGLGFGMFWQVANEKAAHNAFVHCYTEIGVVGYWVWFGLLSLGSLGIWRTRIALARARDLDGRWLRRSSGLVMAAAVGFCASAYFLSRAYVFPMFFLFAMMAAVPRLATQQLAGDEEADQGEGGGEPVAEDQFELLGTGKDIWLFNSVATFVSIFYIYWSILLLNKAFYG